MENYVRLTVHGKDGSASSRRVGVKSLNLARHCGRNIEATKQVLDSFRAQGYQVHGNPSVCGKSRYLLTQENDIEVQGPQTSGEVEMVAIVDGGDVLVTVGSDHDDRTIESMWTDTLGNVYDTAKIKQMGPCVMASDAWYYDDVKDHWDDLRLKSYVTVDGKKILYQDFNISHLLTLEYHFKANPKLKQDGTVLFCGTGDVVTNLPADVYGFQQHFQGLKFFPDFHYEVNDPVLKRGISHYYNIHSIEPVGSLSL